MGKEYKGHNYFSLLRIFCELSPRKTLKLVTIINNVKKQEKGVVRLPLK